LPLDKNEKAVEHIQNYLKILRIAPQQQGTILFDITAFVKDETLPKLQEKLPIIQAKDSWYLPCCAQQKIPTLLDESHPKTLSFLPMNDMLQAVTAMDHETTK
jgi:hypothetical protein